MDKLISKIEDTRLQNYVTCLRSGSTQIFYTGVDYRDFKVPRSPDGSCPDKPDTIRINPPEPHYYAVFFNDAWYWANGCEECNGRPRNSWKSYVECDEHNVCTSCKASRSASVRPLWGGREGWTCNTCNNRIHEEEKQKALADMPEKFDPLDFSYLDNVTCPYCKLEFESTGYYGSDSEKVLCDRCDNTFTVTAYHEVTFTTERTD